MKVLDFFFFAQVRCGVSVFAVIVDDEVGVGAFAWAALNACILLTTVLSAYKARRNRYEKQNYQKSDLMAPSWIRLFKTRRRSGGDVHFHNSLHADEADKIDLSEQIEQNKEVRIEASSL